MPATHTPHTPQIQRHHAHTHTTDTQIPHTHHRYTDTTHTQHTSHTLHTHNIHNTYTQHTHTSYTDTIHTHPTDTQTHHINTHIYICGFCFILNLVHFSVAKTWASLRQSLWSWRTQKNASMGLIGFLSWSPGREFSRLLCHFNHNLWVSLSQLLVYREPHHRVKILWALFVCFAVVLVGCFSFKETR